MIHEQKENMNAYIYTRVSHTSQADKGTSLDNQMDRLRQFCALNGWTIAGEYIDPAYSGRNFKRPAFQKMMADLRSNSIVLVHSLSRFGRNTREVLDQIDKLTKQDIMFYSMDINVDTSTSHGKMILSIMSALAQFESDNTSDRIKSVMGNRKLKGLRYCGNPPLGLEVKNGKLVENGDMTTVRFIFALKSKGWASSFIANHLNKTGYTGAKGGKFQANTINKILNNKIYDLYVQQTT